MVVMSCFKIVLNVMIYLKLYFFYFDEILTFIKDVTVNWIKLNDSPFTTFTSVAFTSVVVLDFVGSLMLMELLLLVFIVFVKNLVLLIMVWSDCFGAHSNKLLIVNFFEVGPVNLPFRELLDPMLRLIQAISSWCQYFKHFTKQRDLHVVALGQ